MRLSVAVRWSAAMLLAVYGFVIFKLTLQPAYTESGTFGLLNRIMSRLSNGQLEWSQTEVIANVALFVPAGFLVAIVVGRVWLSAILCLGASAGIEFAQQRWLSSRVPSLADVEHNGLGGAIGALIAWPIAHWARTASNGERRAADRIPTTEWPSRELIRR
jgi:glycopeptide antibiotics resistance protein